MDTPDRDTEFGPIRPAPSIEGLIAPLLRIDEAGSDLDAIRTWREALADALAIQGIPQDLFALWSRR